MNQVANNAGTINVEIAVPWKKLHSFWKNLEMSFVNFEINLILIFVRF